MRYYPVFLDIKGRPATVVGGGTVAERKVESLLLAGASVRVISPRATKRLEALADEGKITILKRKYTLGDLKGSFVAISASDSKEVNYAVFEEAKAANILINAVDDPEHCNFIVPSIVDRGGLIIAISTSGKSPLLAKTIRQDLESYIGREYETFIEILGAARKKLLKSSINHDKKERVIKELVSSPIPVWLKEGRLKEINGLLKSLLGEGYSLSRLGIKITEQKTTKK